MAMEHVAGKNAGDIKVYALSTCPWCKKTKQLLNDLGVEYSFVDVDLLTGQDREKTIGAIRKWNPSVSFPTLVINNSKSIVGFKEIEIKEALKESTRA
jgi:glutaredoxin-like protein NrdH